MNTNDHQTWIVAAVVIVALIAAVAFVVREHRRRQSQHLQRRFGPEYARVLEAGGDRSKAEAELLAREKRVALEHRASRAGRSRTLQ
jgi:hypothetical protein